MHSIVCQVFYAKKLNYFQDEKSACEVDFFNVYVYNRRKEKAVR